MRYFLSRKKQESVEESKKTCQRRGSALKDSEKRCFRIFDNKLTEKVASMKKYGLWRLVKTIK